MSDTPRTDAVQLMPGSGYYEMRDLSEQLERELAAMTARVQALTDTETKLRSVIEMNIETIDFVTARAELAERQVKLLIPFVTRACPPAGHVRNVRGCASSYSCDGCWDEWSREAAKGVQG